MQTYPHQISRPHGKILLLTLSALGVVFGDIGTGPLYAINEIFFGHPYAIQNDLYILGPISLVIWTLAIIISFKYITFVLRADNDGEGGVFALYGKLHQYKNKSIHMLKIILMLAAGLLLGESIITPAISVLSAVEGVGIINPSFNNSTVTITITILFFSIFISKKRNTFLRENFWNNCIYLVSYDFIFWNSTNHKDATNSKCYQSDLGHKNFI
jgi:KUP system potassium uptake protein